MRFVTRRSGRYGSIRRAGKTPFSLGMCQRTTMVVMFIVRNAGIKGLDDPCMTPGLRLQVTCVPVDISSHFWILWTMRLAVFAAVLSSVDAGGILAEVIS